MYPIVAGRTRNAVYFAPDNGGGNGGGNNAAGGDNNRRQQDNKGDNNNNNNNNNRGDGNNKDGENNSGDFDLSRGNIWDEPRRDNNNKDGNGNNNANNNGNNNNNNNNNGNNNNTDDAIMGNFDKFINNKQWKFELKPEQIQAFVEKGDVAGLSEAITSTNRQMYKDIMLDSARMVNAAVDRAVEQAVGKSNQNQSIAKSRETLERVVPISKNPNVKPVAEAVMATFIKKGMSHEDAAKQVQKFFDGLRNTKGRDLGLEDPPRGDRNNNRGSRAANDDDDLIDWMSFASGDQA